MKDSLLFFYNFVRHPKSTGAVFPSSRRLAEKMIDGAGLETAASVVELGPGTGAFTGTIAERLDDPGIYLGLELREKFAAIVQDKFPQLLVVNDSAEKIVENLGKIDRQQADAIISGLPWAAFDSNLQKRIMSSVTAALAPGGKFSTFTYLHACRLPAGKRFRALLDDNFSDVQTSKTVWRNLPPAFVYHCTK
ncbi:MAG: rRNA adenine N-6-methyltransferase family protein [Planctomycetota bacterium]|nr:rRNA adenine N-6-methyltransferase family protein [Planctomycetota bacterium]